MSGQAGDTITGWLRGQVVAARGGLSDFDALLALVGDAHIVLLGAATHGTAEFYMARAQITRRLVSELGFQIVAVEADWPGASRVNRFVQGGEGTAPDALESFRRFPAWLWRNNVVLDFIEWLRRFNGQIPGGLPRVTFAGLDLFNLPGAISEVLRQLQRTGPEEARHAADHYACLGPPGPDSREWAFGVHLRPGTCEDQVAKLLAELQDESFQVARRGGYDAEFEAEMNALAVLHGEQYYRRLLVPDGGIWNLRDRHMVQVLDRLLARCGPGAGALVWAHSAHVGDLAATPEGAEGKVNLGGILREKYSQQVVAVGLGTYDGTVTAAPQWDQPPAFAPLPAAKAGSYEEAFHQAGIPRFFLGLRSLTPAGVPDGFLFEPRVERAVGVVYQPDREPFRLYVPSRLARRYDAYFFYDRTLAVEPLDREPVASGLQAFPTGL